QQQPTLPIDNHRNCCSSHITTSDLENLPRSQDNGHPLRKDRACDCNRRRQHPLRRTCHSYRRGRSLRPLHINNNLRNRPNCRLPGLGATSSTAGSPSVEYIKGEVSDGSVSFEIRPLPLLCLCSGRGPVERQRSVRCVPGWHSHRDRATRRVREGYWKHQENLSCTLHARIFCNRRP